MLRSRARRSPSRSTAPRQQTLEAALDWSYDLLSEPEQRLLRALAIFPAGFDQEAAAAVCPDGGLERLLAQQDQVRVTL